MSKSTTQLFEEIEELTDIFDDIDSFYIPSKFGDLLIYDNTNNRFNILAQERCGKEQDKSIIGIIVQENPDMSLDVITKNYLTTSKITIPLSYYNKLSYIPAYLYKQFERYTTKYKRISELDISPIKFYVPNIAQLDYIDQNIETLNNLLCNIWSNERRDDFMNRLYTNGLFSTYKGKYYNWLPVKNKKRLIQNFNIYNGCEFLPMFTIKINY